MPNGTTHRAAGGWGAVFTYLMIQNNSEVKEEIDLGEILFSTFVGTATSRIPDILEPPLNPNHRAFFHSLAFGGIVSFVGVRAWKDLQVKRNERKVLGIEQMSVSEIIDIILLIGSASVLLHLLMDGFTPKGLPLL